MGDILDWFAGGGDGYLTLGRSLRYDRVWIAAAVVLDLFLSAGVALIAFHWWRFGRHLRPSPAGAALAQLKTIFLLCGLCGYLFVPLRIVWPAWRLYVLAVAAIAVVAWRFALRKAALGSVYEELERCERLTRELQDRRDDSERRADFLRAVGHDLKTPLSTLLLQTELAEVSLAAGESESLSVLLREMKECARSTAHLVENLLELASINDPSDAPRLASFRVDLLLREVVDVYQPRAQAQGLTLGLDELPITHLVSDREKVARVVAQLLDNALKFSRSGAVCLAVEARPGWLTIHVTDTGEGIAPELQGAIFEAFVQVHNSERDYRKGHGLGLAIARRLTRQLGGQLSVESQAGGGSRFSLRLPHVLEPPGKA